MKILWKKMKIKEIILFECFTPKEILNMEFTPQNMGLTQDELNACEKRVIEIINFLEEREPQLMYFLRIENLTKEFAPFFHGVNDIITDLVFGSKKNLDFKNFPWKEEIRKNVLKYL